MNNADRKEFAQLLTQVLSFYGKEASQFALSVWWQACQPFELEQVRKALTLHALDPEAGQFAPKPADLVRQLVGTQTDRALVAWGKVAKAASQVGAYTDVVFDDPIIHLCVMDVGGWPKVCRTPYEEQGHLQHKFCEAYRAYARRGIPEDYPARLAGAGGGADDYAKIGRTPPPPTLIGDKAAARAVLERGTAARLAGQASPVLSVVPALTRLGVAA